MRYSHLQSLTARAEPHHSCMAVIDRDAFESGLLPHLTRSEYLPIGADGVQLRPGEVSLWRSVLISAVAPGCSRVGIEIIPTHASTAQASLDLYLSDAGAPTDGRTRRFRVPASLFNTRPPVELPALARLIHEGAESGLAGVA
jgi:hypothetical protein